MLAFEDTNILIENALPAISENFLCTSIVPLLCYRSTKKNRTSSLLDNNHAMIWHNSSMQEFMDKMTTSIKTYQYLYDSHLHLSSTKKNRNTNSQNCNSFLVPTNSYEGRQSCKAVCKQLLHLPCPAGSTGDCFLY